MEIDRGIVAGQREIKIGRWWINACFAGWVGFFERETVIMFEGIADGFSNVILL